MVLFYKYPIEGRMVTDFWTKLPRTATLQGIFFSMMVSLFFYSIFIIKSKKEKFLKFLLIGCIIFSIIATLNTATRTLIYISILVFIINIIIYFYLSKKNFKKIIKLIILLGIILNIIIIIYNTDTFGLKTAIENTQLYKREVLLQSSGYKDERFKSYTEILSGIYLYPMGGRKIDITLKYAHNLWLDTALVVGIIPFINLIIYTILTLFTIIYFLKNKYISEKNKYLITSVYSALIINFMVEPILEGIPHIFILSVIINGITNKYIILTKHEIKNKLFVKE
ncbi:hypothetical protein QTI79_04170 [Clostridium perfringens]|nr:hypothetical protein [Clostridium perfringens]